MSARYDLYETPDPKKTGKKQPLHARIVPNGTYSRKEFLERVARFQHLPPNILNGALDAIMDELADSLAEGYNVELGELGFFSTSLKCLRPAMNKKEIRAESIRFDNVHLRVSKEFRMKVHRAMELERVEKTVHVVKKVQLTQEQRIQLLREFLQKNGGITRLEYSRMISEPRLKAIEELNAFIQQGILRKRGAGRNVFYVLVSE